MRNYVTLSEEEKNSIKQLHSSFYNGYATLSPNNNEQPLLQDNGPSDTNGITINNKGHVKTYTNHLVNESEVEDMSIDMTVDALIDAGVDLNSQVGSPSYPDEDITIYEEDMTEGETCEACGGEMKEGECLECGSKTMYEEDLLDGETCEACGGEMKEGECLECGSGSMYEEMDDNLKESFIEQKDKINEMFNRMSKFS